MEELKPCPFCGGGCIQADEMESMWDKSETCWRLICLDCCADIQRETEQEAIAAWNRRAETENKPVTLDELREMDGEPVWCVDGGGLNRCCLVNAGYGDCIDNESTSWNFEFYGMTGDGKNGLHRMGWIAYHHKPKGETE